MKKILICCFALLLLHNSSQGQVNYKDPAVLGAFLKKQAEDVKNNAEFVFEGFYQRRDIYPRKNKKGEVYYLASVIDKNN